MPASLTRGKDLKVNAENILQVFASLMDSSESVSISPELKQSVIQGLKQKRFFEEMFHEYPSHLLQYKVTYAKFPEVWDFVCDSLEEFGDSLHIWRLFNMILKLDESDLPADHRIWPTVLRLVSQQNEFKRNVSLETSIRVRNVLVRRFP